MPDVVTGKGVDRAKRAASQSKILLVDEDNTDLQLYTELLRGQGHTVDCCATYLEGAERLEREWYDLIILSQGGGSFEGQPLLERAIELDRRRPVLVLTRAVDIHSYLDVMYLGAHDYVEKPSPPWEILKTVAGCLGRCIGAA